MSVPSLAGDPRSSILDPRSSKHVICLIGGIGSGKSRVAAELVRRGARVVSGDAIGHEALRQPEIRERVVQRWGSTILDEHGEVSRRKLGAIVFADPGERQALEALVFPWIGRRLDEEVRTACADPKAQLVVVDAAVLLEAGWYGCCDWIVYVHAPRPVRLRRLAEQRGWNEKEVDARARAQLALTAKASRADFAVDNSGPADQLARQLDFVLSHLGAARRLAEVGSCGTNR
jgi:dephospho-CoA kinase